MARMACKQYREIKTVPAKHYSEGQKSSSCLDYLTESIDGRTTSGGRIASNPGKAA